MNSNTMGSSLSTIRAFEHKHVIQKRRNATKMRKKSRTNIRAKLRKDTVGECRLPTAYGDRSFSQSRRPLVFSR